jgi:hypothetical protein
MPRTALTAAPWSDDEPNSSSGAGCARQGPTPLEGALHAVDSRRRLMRAELAAPSTLAGRPGPWTPALPDNARGHGAGQLPQGAARRSHGRAVARGHRAGAGHDRPSCAGDGHLQHRSPSARSPHPPEPGAPPLRTAIPHGSRSVWWRRRRRRTRCSRAWLLQSRRSGPPGRAYTTSVLPAPSLLVLRESTDARNRAQHESAFMSESCPRFDIHVRGWVSSDTGALRREEVARVSAVRRKISRARRITRLLPFQVPGRAVRLRVGRQHLPGS